MKKKYQRPLIKVLSVENESLLNGGSVVNYHPGNTQGTLGSDTSSGGSADGDGTVWGDAKPYNPWTAWD